MRRDLSDDVAGWRLAVGLAQIGQAAGALPGLAILLPVGAELVGQPLVSPGVGDCCLQPLLALLLIIAQQWLEYVRAQSGRRLPPMGDQGITSQQQDKQQQ